MDIEQAQNGDQHEMIQPNEVLLSPSQRQELAEMRAFFRGKTLVTYGGAYTAESREPQRHQQLMEGLEIAQQLRASLEEAADRSSGAPPNTAKEAFLSKRKDINQLVSMTAAAQHGYTQVDQYQDHNKWTEEYSAQQQEKASKDRKFLSDQVQRMMSPHDPKWGKRSFTSAPPPPPAAAASPAPRTPVPRTKASPAPRTPVPRTKTPPAPSPDVAPSSTVATPPAAKLKTPKPVKRSHKKSSSSNNHNNNNNGDDEWEPPKSSSASKTAYNTTTRKRHSPPSRESSSWDMQSPAPSKRSRRDGAAHHGSGRKSPSDMSHATVGSHNTFDSNDRSRPRAGKGGYKICHNCKQVKLEILRCTYLQPTGQCCKKHYCKACVSTTYKEDLTSILEDEWHCPCCLGTCLVTSCVKHREREMKRNAAIKEQELRVRSRRSSSHRSLSSDFH